MVSVWHGKMFYVQTNTDALTYWTCKSHACILCIKIIFRLTSYAAIDMLICNGFHSTKTCPVNMSSASKHLDQSLLILVLLPHLIKLTKPKANKSLSAF